MRVTAKQVAEKAGVSTATVSRVINKSGKVEEDLRQRIEQVMAELGYTPNIVAQNLATGRTKTVGLLMTNIRSPFFIEATEGIQDYLYSLGYNLLLCNTKFSKEMELDYLQLLNKGLLDGIISSTANDTGERMAELVKQGYPIVLINKRIKAIANTESRAAFIESDIVYGVKLAIDHFVNLGHTNIAMIAGNLNYARYAEAFEGYQAGLQSHGINRGKSLVREVSYLLPNYTNNSVNRLGYSETLELLHTHPETSAILVLYNLMLPGVLQALKHSGRKVPESMSLIHVDDFTMATFLDPPLTVVAQPVYEMGRTSARLLVQKIENPGKTLPEQVSLKPELIIRNSCIPLAKSLLPAIAKKT